MQCPIHNTEFKLVPAGVSKSTNRPYAAFWACPERGCKQRPTQQEAAKPVAAFTKSLDKDLEEMKWQEIGAQKNRSNLAAAWIRSNRPVDEHTFQQLALFEGYVLNGKIDVRTPKVIPPTAPNPVMDKVNSNPKFQEPPMSEQDALWDSIVKSSQ